MKIGKFAIEQFGRWIIGGVPFAAAKNIVSSLNDTGLTGNQKRDVAVAQLQSFGYQLAGFMVNLAIELAVAWLKEKQK